MKQQNSKTTKQQNSKTNNNLKGFVDVCNCWLFAGFSVSWWATRGGGQGVVWDYGGGGRTTKIVEVHYYYLRWISWVILLHV